MNAAELADTLQQMRQSVPGVRACALVEASSGLVWSRSGDIDSGEPLWEAAAEYWRLHQRLEVHFVDTLGELGGCVLYHRRGLLAIVPCSADPALVLVAIGQARAVDWRRWQQQALQLGQRLRAVT